MPITITEFRPEHEPAVAAFNLRMQANNVPFGLPSHPLSSWLPKMPGRPACMETFLAMDGDDVRGGYTLRRQTFWLQNREVPVANYQGPISEGICDRRFMMVGTILLRSALSQAPLLYALGMGGMTQPLPKILSAFNWQLSLVPFHFKVLRPSRFFREISFLRRTPLRRQLANLAAYSGLGAAGIHLVQSWRARRHRGPECQARAVNRFGEWADRIWGGARDAYKLAAIRDATTMNCLFPEHHASNIKLQVTRGGETVGWAVVRCTQMVKDKYFGGMRLGSLVDGLALPEQEQAVADAATCFLQGAGADLVVTNQTNGAWNSALRRAGYWAGPSNFAIALSPQLAEAVGGLPASMGGLHFNRADGDGPIHL